MQFSKLQLVAFTLHCKHGLKQRRAAHVAVRGQLLHQLFKWQILMLEPTQGRRPRLPHDLPEGHVAAQICAHHQGVEAKTDQPFRFSPSAIRYRCAHAKIFLSAVAHQENLERCQQGHE